jgi:hypothetical protein
LFDPIRFILILVVLLIMSSKVAIMPSKEAIVLSKEATNKKRPAADKGNDVDIVIKKKKTASGPVTSEVGDDDASGDDDGDNSSSDDDGNNDGNSSGDDADSRFESMVDSRFRDGGLLAWSSFLRHNNILKQGVPEKSPPITRDESAKCQGNPELSKLMETVVETSCMEINQEFGSDGECNVTLSAYEFNLTACNGCFKFAFDHSATVTPDPYGDYARLLMQVDDGPVVKIFELHDGDTISFVLDSIYRCSKAGRKIPGWPKVTEISEQGMRAIMHALGLSQTTSTVQFMAELLRCIDKKMSYYEIFYSDNLYDEELHDIPLISAAISMNHSLAAAAKA